MASTSFTPLTTVIRSILEIVWPGNENLGVLTYNKSGVKLSAHNWRLIPGRTRKIQEIIFARGKFGLAPTTHVFKAGTA